jgi:hypothetical protein
MRISISWWVSWAKMLDMTAIRVYRGFAIAAQICLFLPKGFGHLAMTL